MAPWEKISSTTAPRDPATGSCPVPALSGCRYRHRNSKGMKMKFLQPRDIKTDVLDRGLGFLDGKVRAIQLQQLGWTRCAQLSPNIAGKFIANFSPSLLTVRAPPSRVPNPTVWNPACSRFNIT